MSDLQEEVVRFEAVVDSFCEKVFQKVNPIFNQLEIIRSVLENLDYRVSVLEQTIVRDRVQ